MPTRFAKVVTLILIIILALPAFAKDQPLILTWETTQAAAMSAVRSSFVTGNFRVMEERPNSLTLERSIDASFRGYERVTVDFAQHDRQTVLTVRAWFGMRASITFGAKHTTDPKKMYGDRFAEIERQLTQR